jgi:lysophospholipase L1-like esterase
MRLVLLRALLVLGTSVICLLGIELVFRWLEVGPLIASVDPQNVRLSDDPTLGYELRPGAPDGELTINSAGFRGREYSVEKPPGTTRIAVIGDSISYGMAVERPLTYPAQLEELLNRHFAARGKSFEVLNFAVSGYSSAQIVETLRVRALRYAPDGVIYGYSLNDPQAYSQEMARLLSHAGADERERLEHFVDSHFGWLHHSRLYVLLRALVPQVRDGAVQIGMWHQLDPQVRALEGGRFHRYLGELHASPETWDPLAAQLDALAALSREYALPVLALVFPLMVDLDRYPLGAVHEQVRLAFRERGMEPVDLLPVFAAFARGSGFSPGIDPMHPNPAGHRLAAHTGLLALLRSGRLPGLHEADFERLLDDEPPSPYAALAWQLRGEY